MNEQTDVERTVADVASGYALGWRHAANRVQESAFENWARGRTAEGNRLEKLSALLAKLGRPVD